MAVLAIFVSAAVAALNRETVIQQAQARYGASTVEAVTDWLKLLAAARSEDPSVQMARINEFFNARTTFSPDEEVWHQHDYWATPLELLASGRGDCEDFAIAKYVSLIAIGFPRASLRLIYVKAQLGGDAGPAQAHMVLGYYARPDSEPAILDNLIGEIRPASSRPDLTPVFSFNGEGLWAGNVRAASHPTERLSRWRDLLARLRNEGFQ